MWRIAVLTSLYPSSVRPHEGIFAERRWVRMRERGHQVRVVQPLPWAPRGLVAGKEAWRAIADTPERESRSGIDVERPRYLHVPKFARANARAFARAGVARILAEERPDVVVADYAWPAAVAAPALRDARIPFVISGRGSDVLQVSGEAGLGRELARFLAQAGSWCAVSRDLVGAMDALGGRPGRGVLVENGVDLELFGARDRGEARRALGRDPRELLVLVVGHWIERKDPLLALAAFDALPRDLAERAKIVLVGRGPLETALRDEIAARGLRERAELVAEVPPERLATWYTAADALLLCSRREGRPNVVLEALACGLPVVATDAGGTRELLEGLDGLLATSREPREIAARLEAVLRRPPEAAELRRRVEPLSWDRGLAALEECLGRAIAEARGA